MSWAPLRTRSTEVRTATDQCPQLGRYRLVRPIRSRCSTPRPTVSRRSSAGAARCTRWPGLKAPKGSPPNDGVRRETPACATTTASRTARGDATGSTGSALLGTAAEGCPTGSCRGCLPRGLSLTGRKQENSGTSPSNSGKHPRTTRKFCYTTCIRTVARISRGES